MTLANWIKRLAIYSLLALPLAGCASGQLHQATQADLWLCSDGSAIETRLAGTNLWLQLPASDIWLELEQKKAASGVRYSDNSGVSVWYNNSRARIATPQRLWDNCQMTASGKPGQLKKPNITPGTNFDPEALVLEAQNTYPDWKFNVFQKGEALLLQNYGTLRIKFTGVKIITQNPIKTIYQAVGPEGKMLEYKVENVLCIEDRTGKPFMHRVELNYLNQTFKGCGQSF